jgi:hypothetical protein
MECAFALKDWLWTIQTYVNLLGAESLRPSEVRLLEILANIIRETSMANTLTQEDQRYATMANTVCRIWAMVFEGPHILDIDQVIKESLQVLVEQVT